MQTWIFIHNTVSEGRALEENRDGLTYQNPWASFSPSVSLCLSSYFYLFTNFCWRCDISSETTDCRVESKYTDWFPNAIFTYLHGSFFNPYSESHSPSPFRAIFLSSPHTLCPMETQPHPSCVRLPHSLLFISMDSRISVQEVCRAASLCPEMHALF